MRRALAALVVIALACAGQLAARKSGDHGDYRVDVIFDNSRGLVPGQLVEVAGGRVGTIQKVSLTPDFKARVHMKVDARFAPFHSDATCTIRAQGLLSENYVQCDPGTPDAAELRGAPPTVPVGHTTQPVSLGDFFDVWTVPTSQRVGVLLSELGVGTAGRGEDINAILLRANPALAEARGIIGTLRAQRADLEQAIDASGQAVAELARDAGAAPDLIAHTAAVLERTSHRSEELATATRQLPGLLRQARPTLAAMDEVVTAGSPLLSELRTAAPQLAALSRQTRPLVDAARPTLAALAPVLDKGAGVLHRTLPLARVLEQYARQSRPSAELTGSLLTDLRGQGFVENLLRFFYNAAAATARFDSTSHIIPAHLSVSPCMLYASKPVRGCTATYGPEPAAAPARRGRRRATAPTTPSRPRPAHAPQTAPAPVATPAPPPPAAQATPKPLLHLPLLQQVLPKLPLRENGPIRNILDLLLG